MAEERADECGAALHLGELRGDAIGQLFALRNGCRALPVRLAWLQTNSSGLRSGA